MENTKTPLLSVSDFIALVSQTLDYAFSDVTIEGEVSGFKVNQNKYVFFDLKDGAGSIGCFMTVWQLRQPIEDGMKIIVTATPKLTDWGKFSLTIKAIRLSGAGSLKRSFELLEKKLEREGLFAAERKRLLPEVPTRIGVISSTQAAGYSDFIKIVDNRWGGLAIDVAHVQVQGREAPDQIIRALNYFNSQDNLPEVIVIIRGGGSLDDLSAFNDELLVRGVATSRVPTLVGVGHETDVTLADRAADVRAATPSDAARIVVPDRKEVVLRTKDNVRNVAARVAREIEGDRESVRQKVAGALTAIIRQREVFESQLAHKKRLLEELDPEKVLSRGYAIVRGVMQEKSLITIETSTVIVNAEVKDVREKA